MTDPSFLPGSVALKAPAGVSGFGFLAASDEHRLGCQVREPVLLGPGMNPPSKATSRGAIPSRLSSATGWRFAGYLYKYIIERDIWSPARKADES